MKNENNQSQPQINPAQYGYPMMYPQEDEIDLFELWNKIWQRKGFIIIMAMLAGILAYAYVSLSKPVYQSTVYLSPPLSKDIQLINAQEITITEASVYGEFQKNLQSRQIRRHFFEQNKLLDWFNKDGEPEGLNEALLFEKSFNEKLKINPPKKGNVDYISMSFEIDDQKLSAKWLNAFVDFVISITNNQILESAAKELDSVKADLNSKLIVLRRIALKKRFDRIDQLQESLEIAILNGNIEPVNWLGNNLGRDYLIGSKAIESELKVLRERKSDDPFIVGLHDIQERIAFIDTISIEGKKIKSATIEQKAVIPSSRIKPKKLLVVVIAFILGLIIAILWALIKGAVDNHRNREMLDSEED